MKQVSGILLAAGQGRRFGSNKLLHPLEDGLALVVHSARKLRAVLSHSLVVVNGRDHESIRLLANEGVQIVINDNANAGMGTSIARGVRASSHADGWVIALADMPYINEQTIRCVAAGIHHRNSICAPQFEGQRGHPVGFGKAYGEALMGLTADEGARSIIETHQEKLEVFETGDRGVIRDIDRRYDVQAKNTNL